MKSLLVLTCLVATICASRDEFHEELLLKPLETGHLLAHFQFTTIWKTSVSSFKPHYHLFPKSIGDVVLSSNVQELHFSISQGLWRSEKWGYPVLSAPPGAEIWAWFQETTPDVEDAWTKVTSAISGMFCASTSINQQILTTRPQLSFRPRGVSQSADVQNTSFTRYVSLAKEHVCTENLSPWKKLLPCFSSAGLGSLLRGSHVFNTDYHLLHLSVKPVCLDESCYLMGLELSQAVSIVFDVAKKGASMDWSLRQLFGSAASNRCVVAESSKIYVDRTLSSKYQCSLSPQPNEHTVGHLHGQGVAQDKEIHYDVFNMKTGDFGGVSISYKCLQPFERVYISPPLVQAHQFLTGYGQEHGGIMCEMTNWERFDVPVMYMLLVPWYIRLYLHTLVITDYKGREIKPLYKFYIPGKDRLRPYHLELILRLPEASTIHLSIKYELTLLRWTEYPPDANHGFYIPSSVISFQMSRPSNLSVLQYNQGTSLLSERLSASSPPYFIRLYTESLLVSLPTPDFSMPYNVICLTCTVVAIVFGSVHNMTTRRLVLPDAKKKQSLIARLRGKVLGLFTKKSSSVNKENKEIDTDKESEHASKDLQ